ncbi:MAG: FtsX-like permease family protein [Ruminiclostridium sp.]|nr:FtsX-like permease family protein [Ruminiclostridium sp.]
MRIIIKYILKNLWEKKLRTLLILFSVMTACGLFFSSSAIGDTFAQLYINRINMYYGQTDIIIQPDDRSPSPWLKLEPIKNMENIRLAAGRFESSATYRSGTYEKTNLILLGTDWEASQQINPVQVLSENGLESFAGMKIVLPREFCEKYGYRAGDSINLTINGGLRKLTIVAVATGGIFTENGSTAFGILPADTLSALHNARGAFNSIQVCLEDESMVTQTIAQLQDIYKGYQVQQPFNGEDIKREMESITLPFMLMTFIVAFMSMFIIFSSFRVITMERLPVIGTFRSIGATRKTTDNIMLVESLLYGIVGSGLGLGLGIIILNIMSETLKDPWIKDMETRAVYTPSQMGLSFAFGVLLCFASS